jgi:hypothetical protein
MPPTPDNDLDPRRVRIGLAFLLVVVLVTLAVIVLVANPVARLLMVAILLFTVGRTGVLFRGVRRDARERHPR